MPTFPSSAPSCSPTIETIGTDAGQAGGFDPPFPNHTIMHGAGKFGLASLCNLDQLPSTGAIVIAAPLKIVQGSGSPLRVIALALTAARDFPELTILLMTGFADQRERAHGLNAIVHDVVTKPFSVADIRTAVADALAVKKAR